MILSGLEIAAEVNNGNIKISEFNPKQLNPNSYNLKLGELYVVDPNISWEHSEIKQVLDYLIEPGKLYLGKTIEQAGSNQYVPMIEGRSTAGRRGVTVHISAGFGDIGYIGTWTLEITCVYPIRLRYGLEICQISFQEIKGPYIQYSGRYQGGKLQ